MCAPCCANAAAVHDCGLGHNTLRCVVRCRAAGARATGYLNFSSMTFIRSVSSLTLSCDEARLQTRADGCVVRCAT